MCSRVITLFIKELHLSEKSQHMKYYEKDNNVTHTSEQVPQFLNFSTISGLHLFRLFHLMTPNGRIMDYKINGMFSLRHMGYFTNLVITDCKTCLGAEQNICSM